MTQEGYWDTRSPSCVTYSMLLCKLLLSGPLHHLSEGVIHPHSLRTIDIIFIAAGCARDALQEGPEGQGVYSGGH